MGAAGSRGRPVTDAAMMLAYVGPMLTVAAAAWRMSARLAKMDARLAALERENRDLKAELGALRTLLSVLVDSRRQAG